MTHRNARLTPVTRAELVERVTDGWPQAEVGLPATYYSNRQRLDALPRFLAYSNHRRPHGTRRGYSRLTPVNNILGNYT